MKKFILLALLSSPLMAQDSMNVNISGKANEKAPLETLSPSPDLPKLTDIPFSKDGGKSAAGDEVSPISLSEAALKFDAAQLTNPVIPSIPYAPFIVQPIPEKDLPQLLALQQKLNAKNIELAISSWTWSVIDDQNNTVFTSTGEGFPKKQFEWDGKSDRDFGLKPNRTYSPFLILSSSGETSITIPGEAGRFSCFLRSAGAEDVLYFSESIYEKGGSQFSSGAQIYLDDLKWRLSLLLANKDKSSWSLILHEPSSENDEESARREFRKKTWVRFLKNLITDQNIEDRIILSPSVTNEASAEFILRNAPKPPVPAMHGVSRELVPGFEDKSTWVQIKNTKDVMIVEVRHDRVFRPGTAFLRDEALSLIMEALEKVKKEGDRIRSDAAQPIETDKKVRKEKKKEPGKTILVRALMAKPKDNKGEKTLEDDPKLAALRSKVLFALFSKARYLQ